MNKYQWLTVAVAVLNVALILLFPPFDYMSLTRASAPIFDGFYFVFDDNAPRIVNSSFLQIEIFVVLINASIAWLLLRDSPGKQEGRRVDWQKVVLFGVGLNLLLVLLFPPMENYYALTRAALPSFDGFYFLFGDHAKRALVTQILYLEVIFVLVNGAMLWMLFRKSKPVDITAAARAVKAEMQRMEPR
ncbi:MAG: hypothetical protein EXR27_12795 [Betaproteobacteria bacterium]|nr:hypothetical protein [Betaproteobacteria bacterium]